MKKVPSENRPQPGVRVTPYWVSERELNRDPDYRRRGTKSNLTRGQVLPGTNANAIGQTG
jgi:hypothetical protein